MPENGEFSKFMTTLYSILVAIAIGTGFLGIVTLIFADGGFIDLSINEILQMLVDKIIKQI